MLSNAKKAWHVALAFVLATALALPSLAFGLDGKGDTSTAADGTMAVYVEDEAGNTALMKTYTADEFAALATEVDAGYQYTKNDVVNVLAVKKLVEFDKLIADAGASAFWTEGAKLQFTCTDGVYKKSVPSYEQLHETGFFYPNRSNTELTDVSGAIEVPAGIAIPGWYKSVRTAGEISADALTAALGVLDGTITDANQAGNSTKVAIGIARDLSSSEEGAVIDAGMRLTGSVVAITIKAPAGVTVNSISNCEINGTDTQYYTGSAITPITVSDQEGNLLAKDVDYTIEYADNVNAGTASFTITGIGNYVGQVKGTFTITDKILNVQLNGMPVKSYTMAELVSKLSTDTQYYQQSNHGSVVGYAATDYITFADLLKDAGIDQYWTEGSNLQYICTDGLYGKNQPTFEEIAEQNLFYPNQSATDVNNITDAVESPAILAFTYGSQKSDGEVVSDTAQAAAANMSTYPLAKVFRGWKADETGTINAPGWRLATGVVTVNLQTTHASKIFSDVEADSWYEDAVTFCNFTKFMTGYAGTDLFGPSNALTRAEFATVLYRIMNPDAASADFTNVKNETNLPDVEDGKFYTPAANWAVAEGIISGVDGKEFQPNTPCDRQTMCVILSRLFKAENPSMDKLNAMPDAEGVAVWATEGVAWALNEGVISGVDVEGTRYIQADTVLSRAMAAQVVANSCYNGLF